MTNPSSIPLADRVARYLVRRLERQAIRNAYEAAEAIGLLERHFGSDELAPNGPICWNIRQPLTLALSGDPVVDRRVIERFLSRRDSSLPEPSPDFEFDDDNERPVVGHTISGRPVRSQRPSALNDKSRRGRSLKALVAQKGSSPVLTRDTGPAKEPKSAASTENGSAGHHAVDRDYVLRLIRAHRTPHHVADVAVALLLASAAGEAFNHIDPLLSLLVRPAPVVVIRSSVAEFERRFGTMLERGAVMPFALSLVDAFGDKSISGSYRDNASDPHRAASISGKRVQDLSSKALREAVAKAFLRKELPLSLWTRLRRRIFRQGSWLERTLSSIPGGLIAACSLTCFTSASIFHRRPRSRLWRSVPSSRANSAWTTWLSRYGLAAPLRRSFQS